MSAAVTTAKPVCPPPPDPRLPALTTLLDARLAADVLWRSLGSDPGDVRIVAVRYKPRRRLVVEYRLSSATGSQTVVALLDAKGDGCLVQRWPQDAALPALSLPVKQLAETLGIDPAVPERLGYKPFTRATLRVGENVVKLYASYQKWRRAAAALERVARRGLAELAPAPAAEGLRATVQRFVEGCAPDGLDAAHGAAALLRRFHAAPHDRLPRVGPDARLDESRRAATLVATLIPTLRTRTDRLVAALARRLPDDDGLVAAHGDFEPGQLVAGDAGLALVDVDDLCAAPAADDLGRYAAHVVRGDSGDAQALRTVSAALAEGYGTRPAGLDWYVTATILARAAAPFRRQDPEWPRRVEAFVAIAEQRAQEL